MDIKKGWIHTRALVLAISASLAAIGAFLPTTAAQQAPANTQERTRLLQAQRDARSHLQDATRPDTTAEQVRRALQAASRNLETLSAATTILDPSLRTELRGAARALVNWVQLPAFIITHSKRSSRSEWHCSYSMTLWGL